MNSCHCIWVSCGAKATLTLQFPVKTLLTDAISSRCCAPVRFWLVVGLEMTIPASNSKNGRKWFAVAVLPHADAQAKAHLLRQGFEVFAPTLLRTVRHARQFRTKLAPLFPGYLFVNVDLAEARWRSINGTRGVRSIVSAGERPLPVPDSVIAALQPNETRPAPLEPGTQLEIVSGPFAGLLAQLERLDGGTRVAVLMQLIGGSVSVTLPLETVRAAS